VNRSFNLDDSAAILLTFLPHGLFNKIYTGDYYTVLVADHANYSTALSLVFAGNKLNRRPSGS
jgi:hypothetical protein